MKTQRHLKQGTVPTQKDAASEPAPPEPSRAESITRLGRLLERPSEWRIKGDSLTHSSGLEIWLWDGYQVWNRTNYVRLTFRERRALKKQFRACIHDCRERMQPPKNPLAHIIP